MALDLSSIPLIDSHCHSLQRGFGQLEAAEFLAYFSEADDPVQTQHHVPYSLLWLGAQRLLASKFKCSADVNALVQARQEQPPADLIASLLDGSPYRDMLVDSAYPPGGIPLQELRALLPANLHEIVRIESVAEQLLPSSSGLADFRRKYSQALEAAAANGAIAFKSIIAYRSGLNLERPTESKVRTAYKRERQQAEEGDGQVRLREAPLLALLLYTALEIASGHGLPCQFHSGFGDADVDLRLSDPLHLRPLFTEPAFANVPMVILHAGYPFVRQAGFLASTYPHVYIDCSLAIPFLHTGIETLLTELLELAPFTKLLFGSDTHGIPEHWLLAARWGERALSQVLNRYVDRGWLSAAQARSVAELILWKNAAALYRLSDDA